MMNNLSAGSGQGQSAFVPQQTRGGSPVEPPAEPISLRLDRISKNLYMIIEATDQMLNRLFGPQPRPRPEMLNGKDGSLTTLQTLGEIEQATNFHIAQMTQLGVLI